MDNITPEFVSENLEQYKELMQRDHLNLEMFIDTLPKQALCRLVKLYSGCNLARDISLVPLLQLHPDEEKAVKNGMKLQDDCLGYMKLTQELNDKKQEGESNGN